MRYFVVFALLLGNFLMFSCAHEPDSNSSSAPYLSEQVDKIYRACERHHQGKGMSPEALTRWCQEDSQRGLNQLITSYQNAYTEKDVAQVCDQGVSDSECPMKHQLRFFIEHSPEVINQLYP